MNNKTEEPATIENEKAFFDRIRESLIILSTSSLDKIDEYGRLFGSLGIEDGSQPSEIGINAYFSDIGRFGDVATKTDEKTQSFTGNAEEKSLQQLRFLQDNDTKIRSRLAPHEERGNPDAESNRFDPQKIPIVGMTEDSGWQVVLKGANDNQKKDFIAAIKKQILPLIRLEDSWLIDKIHIPENSGHPDETGFPGPNLKPIQEHIGGFHNLMKIIYNAADAVGIKDLGYRSVVTASFSFPEDNAKFSKTFTSEGRLLTRQEYKQGIIHSLRRGDVINADFVQIPGKQKTSPHVNASKLYDNGILAKSSTELPADMPRRALAEWLQEGIGKRTITPEEQSRHVKIGFVTPDGAHTLETTVFPNVSIGTVPSDAELLKNPHKELLSDVDAVVLIPAKNPHSDDNTLYHDPNLALLLKFVVAREAAEPHAMYKPLLIDNRSGKFSKALNIVRSHFMDGRKIGEPPFVVANNQDEFDHYIAEISNEARLAPRIITQDDTEKQPAPEIQNIRDDGKFTLFIGGGHSNNNKRDREEAFKLGYLCAKKDWRIVTGAGSVEGSMGSVHTGFIQYHLDTLLQPEKIKDEALKTVAENLIRKLDALEGTPDPKTGIPCTYKKLVDGKMHYDAEKLILNQYDLIDSMANTRPPLIPRKMFYGYSFKNVLKLENPSGKPPPGITYSDASNLPRRIAALLTPGTKVIMPGSVGTDQEVVEAIHQHLKAREMKGKERAFKDGTPNDNGMLIIYNVNGQYDELLKKYKLDGRGMLAQEKREMYNIVVVDEYKDLSKVLLGYTTKNEKFPGRAHIYRDTPSIISR